MQQWFVHFHTNSTPTIFANKKSNPCAPPRTGVASNLPVTPRAMS